MYVIIISGDAKINGVGVVWRFLNTREATMKIKGSVALVTGANGGIGRAFVQELLKRGATKIYLGARDPLSLRGLFTESGKLVPISLDLTNPKQIEEAANAASDITLLINNAGAVAFSGALSAKDSTAARLEMEVNYFGTLALTRALLGTPALQRGGAIVNVLSLLATLPVAGTYSASKSAALALTRTLRAELKSRGVQVVGVMPVQTATPAYAPLPEPKLKPEEVAAGTLDGLEAGEEDIFPGALSRGAADAFKSNPAALQAHLSTMVHAID
jgi:short-subunit dehydrogenase